MNQFQKKNGIEIERKFLVSGNDWKSLGAPVIYRQGYLNDDKERTVRVRVIGDKAYLTVKGKTTGATRCEFEYEIPVTDALVMLQTMTLRPLIEKTRTVINYKGHLWEVDEFLGDNVGLVIAEIELTNENENFEKPDWIGEEVTEDTRYYNSNLIRQPFSTWFQSR